MFTLTILTKRACTRFVNGQSVPAIEFGLQHDNGEPNNQGNYPGLFRMYVDPNSPRAQWDLGQVLECTEQV